jgi:hypothetical protein
MMKHMASSVGCFADSSRSNHVQAKATDQIEGRNKYIMKDEGTTRSQSPTPMSLEVQKQNKTTWNWGYPGLERKESVNAVKKERDDRRDAAAPTASRHSICPHFSLSLSLLFPYSQWKGTDLRLNSRGSELAGVTSVPWTWRLRPLPPRGPPESPSK